jgi:uncharacterized protein
MRLCTWLPFIAAAVLLVTPLPAQQDLPMSTQQRLAAVARVEVLTPDDFKSLLSQTQSGDREAQYLLALVYEEGLLVPRDFAAARRWMLMSAEQGYLAAEAGLGEMYLTNVRHNDAIPDYGDADRWLRLAATQGDAGAQSWLGTAYERGWFGAIDYREALKWIRKAAAQGLPDAQFCLGQMYEDGEGVPESNFLAASWYRKAADHLAYVGDQPVGGVREAAIQLAYMYRDGRLKPDYVEAYMWFAIVGSSVDPPTDDDMKRAAQHMTKAQIAHAQRMARDWIKRHTHPPESIAQAKAREN